METYHSRWITKKVSQLLGILCIFHSLGTISNVNFECWLQYCKKHQFTWLCALSGFTKESHNSTPQMILLLYMGHQVDIYFTLLQISGTFSIMSIIHFDLVLIHLHVYIAHYLFSTHSCFPAMERYSMILSNCIS